MTDIDYSRVDQGFSTKERRFHKVDPASTPRRRINDTLFNRIRWPAFVYVWFVAGFILFIALLYWVFGGGD